MSGEGRTGWAIRRYRPDTQNCPPGESGGKTWGDFFACCPESTWLNMTTNSRCGPGPEMGDFTPKARCANSTWTLWYHKGYFCCDSADDLQGYFYNSDDDVGCANKSWIDGADNDVRRAIEYPNAPASTPKASSTNKGAIAGGVVGGVCGALIIVGIIWFLYRYRRQSKTPKNEETPATSNSSPLQPKTHYESIPAELGATSYGLPELDGSLDRKEMPAATQPRQELA